MKATSKNAIRRVGEYLDAVGMPNDHIALAYRRDDDGHIIPPSRKLFAADVKMLLDIARTVEELHELPEAER